MKRKAVVNTGPVALKGQGNKLVIKESVPFRIPGKRGLRPLIEIHWGPNCIWNYQDEYHRFRVLFKSMYGGKCKVTTHSKLEKLRGEGCLMWFTRIYTKGRLSESKKIEMLEKVYTLIGMAGLTNKINVISIYYHHMPSYALLTNILTTGDV